MTEPKKCDVCKENRATIHHTQIIKGNKTVAHLCETCCEEQDPITPDLLAKVVGATQPLIATAKEGASKEGGATTKEKARAAAERAATQPTCPQCGVTLDEFKRTGRLGCPEDYQVFEKSLIPILERIHGSSEHVGRVPSTSDETASTEVQLRTLERELEQATVAEEYERAAELRDRIKEMRGGLHGAD